MHNLIQVIRTAAIRTAAIRTAAIRTAAILSVAITLSAQTRFEKLDLTAIPTPSANFGQPIPADVDGDGNLDLVVPHYGSAPIVRVLLGDGNGRFRDDTLRSLPVLHFQSGSGTTVGDIDNDGDPDIICPIFPPGSATLHLTLVLVNDGTGRFQDETVTRLPLVLTYNRFTSDLELTDLDGDGDLDLVAALYGPPTYFRNDGTGHFTEDATRVPTAKDVWNLTPIDLERDGDTDFIVQAPALEFWVNTGGQLVSSPLPVTVSQADWVAAFDANGDGYTDFIIQRNRQSTLFLNDTRGQFTTVAAPTPTHGYASLLYPLDADGDGDTDLMDVSARGHQLLLNDGVGQFQLGWSAPETRIITKRSCVVDIDRDGDSDFVTFWGASGVDADVYANVKRQTHAPNPPQLGSSFVIRLFANTVDPAGDDAVLSFLSPAGLSQRIPIPGIGELGLDPAQMISYRRTLVPQASGQVDIALPIPQDPRLVGMRLFVQGLWIPASSTRMPRLGNVLSQVIQR